MKDIFKLLFLLPLLIALGCNKSSEPEPGNLEDDMIDAWSSPDCTLENSVLSGKMVIKGTDTTITEYLYDLQGRPIAVNVSNEHRYYIDYISDNRYNIMFHLNNELRSTALVYLSAEKAMDSAVQYKSGESIPYHKVHYSYDFNKRCLGWKSYGAHSGPEVPWSEKAIFSWNIDGNVSKFELLGYDSSTTHILEYEYNKDIINSLYELATPNSGFYYGYPTEMQGGSPQSKNFIKKVSYNSTETIYTPTFDKNNRLIKNVITRFDLDGVEIERQTAYYRYDCK